MEGEKKESKPSPGLPASLFFSSFAINLMVLCFLALILAAPRAHLDVEEGSTWTSGILSALENSAFLSPGSTLLPVRRDASDVETEKGRDGADASGFKAVAAAAETFTKASVTEDSVPCEPLEFVHETEWIRIIGAGSRVCSVGELCSFVISLSEAATWNVSGNKPLEWDLMVNLFGPAIVNAHVAESGTPQNGPHLAWPGKTFFVTFRAWDAGVYRAMVANPCYTLDVPSGKSREDFSPGVGLLAKWDLTVQDSGPRILEVGGLRDEIQKEMSHVPNQRSEKVETLGTGSKGTGQGGNNKASVPKISQRHSKGDMDPCSDTVQARWLEGPEGEYSWTPYSCATWQPLTEALLSLVDRGVREVAFIGDSHLRFLLLHAAYLVTGVAPTQFFKLHAEFSIDVPLVYSVDATGKEGANRKQNSTERNSTASSETGNGARDQSRKKIRFGFYWVDGVYHNGEFGCMQRGGFSGRKNSFPRILRKADVVVMDAGAWSAFRCYLPGLAYPSHLNEFLSAISVQLNILNVTKAIFFGAMPTPTCHKGIPGADYRVTNSELRFQSGVAETMVAHYGMQFFNTWEVVAPLFTKSCSLPDPHFSCTHLPTKKNKTGFIDGVVGQALAQTLFHAIKESYP